MLKLATVFSGIGSIEHALERMSIKKKIVFACDNGDINILSEKINNDIEDIYNEIDKLQNIITKIHVKTVADIDYKDELQIDINIYKKQLQKALDVLLTIDEDKIHKISATLFKKIIVMKNLKKIREKEYISFISELDKNQETAAWIHKCLRYLLEVQNDFRKDNSLNLFKTGERSELKSSDGIAWDDVFDCLKEAYLYLEQIKAKKIIKLTKDVCEQLEMLQEKINSFYIMKELNTIKSSKEKKAYVDSLYEGKAEQNKVRTSYLANYDIDGKDFHWNVSFLDGKQYKNEVDLFVGGSPCQSFSLVGKQRGLDDTRGTLFYEYARLVKEIKPKIFIYENVKAILSNDNGKTWDTMKKVFDDLDYEMHQSILNAKDYGIPQNRERVFVVGFRKDLTLRKPFVFPKPIKLKRTMQDYLVENVSGKYYLPKKGVDFVISEKNLTKRYTQIDGDVQLCQKKNQQFNWHGDFIFVEESVGKEQTLKDLEKYFLSEKVKKYVLSTGTKGFYSRPETDLRIARPLLTTMHKMHRAGVDNYVTTEGRLRKLTPRECLRLMGFCDSFNIAVSDTSMYQQAGNSIVVDVLMAIMTKVIDSYPDIVEEEI